MIAPVAIVRLGYWKSLGHCETLSHSCHSFCPIRQLFEEISSVVVHC